MPSFNWGTRFGLLRVSKFSRWYWLLTGRVQETSRATSNPRWPTLITHSQGQESNEDATPLEQLDGTTLFLGHAEAGEIKGGGGGGAREGKRRRTTTVGDGVIICPAAASLTPGRNTMATAQRCNSDTWWQRRCLLETWLQAFFHMNAAVVRLGETLQCLLRAEDIKSTDTNYILVSHPSSILL